MGTDTEKFKAILARKYPHLKVELLQGLNEEIGGLHGGNGQVLIRLKRFLPEWIDSTKRRFFQWDPK